MGVEQALESPEVELRCMRLTKGVRGEYTLQAIYLGIMKSVKASPALCISEPHFAHKDLEKFGRDKGWGGAPCGLPLKSTLPCGA
jgi:hypothetical protein